MNGITELFACAGPDLVKIKGLGVAQGKKPAEELVESRNPFGSFDNFGNCVYGILHGFVNGFKSMLMFLYHAVTNPIGTLKNLITGGIVLTRLLTNPSELCQVLKNAWNTFMDASSFEKGKVLGEILFNVSPLGNLQNMRLLSSLRRIPISISAIKCNWQLLKRYHRMTGGNWFNTIFAAKRIAAKANLKIDFQRILKAEGIPLELAPKLRFVRKPYRRGVAAWYSASKHEICITRSALNILPISDFIPGFSIGSLLKHEVKHASQSLLIARAGLYEWPLSHLTYVKRARELIPVNPGSKLYKEAQRILKSENKYPCYSAIVTSNNFFTRIYQILKYRWKYYTNLMEIQARYVQYTYQGLMPKIPTPSIHLLEYLAPQTENRENNPIANSNSRNTTNYLA